MASNKSNTAVTFKPAPTWEEKRAANVAHRQEMREVRQERHESNVFARQEQHKANVAARQEKREAREDANGNRLMAHHDKPHFMKTHPTPPQSGWRAPVPLSGSRPQIVAK